MMRYKAKSLAEDLELQQHKANAFILRVERDNAEDFAKEIADDLRTANKEIKRLKAKKRVGRPPSGKIMVTLRLDPEVVAKFKADGPGWQGRINEALKRGLTVPPPTR